ncbi:uncharacterized protein LOC121879705 isoform X3 [Homarus americanus]|uniref:uncharacterized protein LOC121879705 isoform X3 n=1 Tax=Homarus americanus TaxID=6706 RepID=UPI001C4743D6|nr:uncharacterized protein LOC121879705 isoform X3 [Homarus americanus]
MKWRGMSGVGVQEPLIRGPLLARGPCILLVMVMVQAVTCAHPHHQPPPLTTSTTKLRPERAALTPPTVTSLRPPDRSKNGHDAVEITVRGKHGDSNSPPVVASLSPSGINHPQDPPRPNTQQITPDRPPTAPLATAASGSRAEARPTYSLLDQQHIVPGPATNDVPASRLHGIRPLPSTSSSWDSHRPRYPTHKRLPTSRRVFEPMEDDYALVPMSPEEGGGGLAHKDITAEEGGSGETHNAGWDTMNHSPRISQGRPDTFGHDITEDLTHLQDEYSPRNSQGGITGQTFSTFDETDHSASWATGGDASHILDRPEEELNDEGLKQTENDDEERKRKRKRKKEQRDRRRKNRDKKKRQRGRKGQEEADPNLVYTTAILPVDSSKNENGTQFPSPTQVPIWINKSTVALTSTETPRALTVKPLHPLSTVSASPQPPSSKTTLRAVPPPTTPEEKSLSTTSPEAKGRGRDSLTLPPMGKTTKASIENLTVIELPRETDGETVPKYHKPIRRPDHQNPHLDVHRQHKERHRPPKEVFKVPKHISGSTPKQTENEFEGRTNFVREQQKDDYIFPIKGMLIISGVMGALAVFTLVVLISYAVIKCSKKPVVNNYQVSEQKPVTQ